jgi:hypothetical protein
VGPLTHFFRLTSAFFGLTSEYKVPLLEEIYLCTQYLKGFTYADILSLPVYERRYYIGLKNREHLNQQEKNEDNPNTTTGSRGNRKKKVSGEALKNSFRNGDIPLN